MPPQTFERSADLPVRAEDAFAWFQRPGAFRRMIPPWEPITLIRDDGSLRDGARLEHRVKILGPIKTRWLAEMFGYIQNVQFCDRQLAGPFAFFEHIHRFEALAGADAVPGAIPGPVAGAGGTPPAPAMNTNDPNKTVSEIGAASPPPATRLTDHIEYRLPLGPLGRLARGMIHRRLARAFAYRHRLLQADLRRHAQFADRPRMKVAISGSTGLIGSALVPFLTTGGHHVIRLVRQIEKGPTDGTTSVVWDPAEGKLDPDSLEGVDAVVHLAGENIAKGRWTAAKKVRIRESRVQGTSLLARTIAAMPNPPRVFFSASAVGYYPDDQGDRRWTEFDQPGRGFLAEVCQAWEAAAQPARDAEIRTIHGRFGVVLSASGGALTTQLPLFRLGLAGKVGPGRQFIPWIELNDLIYAIHFCLMREDVSGPVNCTTPHPVTNRDYTKTLGRVLRRPTILPAPALALKLALGEMAGPLLLSSLRVEPQRLLQLGFAFEHPGLEAALRFTLGRCRHD